MEEDDLLVEEDDDDRLDDEEEDDDELEDEDDLLLEELWLLVLEDEPLRERVCASRTAGERSIATPRADARMCVPIFLIMLSIIKFVFA